MRQVWCVACVGLVGAMVFSGCADRQRAGSGPTPPHGGEWLSTATDQVRVEMVHDLAAGRLTFYLLDAKLKAAPATETPTLTLVAGEKKEELPLKQVADVQGAYELTHEAFRTEEFEALLSFTIGGAPFTAQVGGEGHHHAH